MNTPGVSCAGTMLCKESDIIESLFARNLFWESYTDECGAHQLKGGDNGQF
jgi:hypothetical protein